MAGPEPFTRSRIATVLDQLGSRKLLVVSGKGGVGRTTVAALAGVALAERGRKVLIATTGHDDRLAWMLGATRLGDTPQNVAIPGLWVQRLVARTCVREYGALALHSQRLSQAVFDSKVVRRLLRAIPGLDDFAVLGKAWHEAVRGGDFDTVIFDGPATGHLLYTLGVPAAILSSVPRGPLTQEAELMRASFKDPAVVAAVLVALPETWPLTELTELATALAQDVEMALGATFINGVWPRPVPSLESLSPPSPPLRAVIDEVRRVGAVGQRHHDAVTRWAAEPGSQGCRPAEAIEVPWRWDGVSELTGLRSLLAALEGPAESHPEVA